jgi:hypothetical protein
MTPITISNTRPGFVPFSVRPLAIVGQQRPAFRPTPYQPPMLANPASAPSLDGPLNMAAVPHSVTLGILGAGSLLLSSIAPSPFKQIAMLAGLGFIGFGLFNLFSGAPAPAGQK